MMMIRQLLNFSRRLGGEITVGKKLKKERKKLFLRKAAKKGLKLIGDSKRAELMVKWRQVRIAAMKVLADQAELANDQANLILKELKKSTN
ncbi:hypothetical protein P8452_18084 [Trifolium repens]|nr:hypothetical protein P8452_18084 [Trifolium repens]